MEQELFQYGLLIFGTFTIISIVVLILRRILNFIIRKNSESLQVNPTSFVFLKNSLSVVLYSIGIIWVFHKIPFFKSLGTALFAGAGVLAAIIGFASQKAFSNIIGGIFILIFKPFKIGDPIEISNNRRGMVEQITLRHTIIRDFEFRRVVIPNSVISDETIINSNITDEKIRKQIEFGIAYDANVDLAEEIILKEILAHPLCIDNRTEEEIALGIPKVVIKLVSLGDFSVVLRAYVWTKNFEDAFNLHCDILRSVKKAFDENQIEIPFPYRTLVFKNQPNETKK